MVVMRESRTEKRAPFEDRQRIILLEQDADSFEASVASIDAKLSKLMWSAVGGLITFGTATVLLAIDLIARVN